MQFKLGFLMHILDKNGLLTPHINVWFFMFLMIGRWEQPSFLSFAHGCVFEYFDDIWNWYVFLGKNKYINELKLKLIQG